MCFCLVLFTGCTYSLPYSSKVSRYTSDITQTEQSFVFEQSDLEGLSDKAKAQLIAEKYISISFTVLIYQVTKTNTNGQITTTEKQYSFGSGFIVHTGGYILTNNHVIDYLKETPTITTSGPTTTEISYKCYVSQDGADTIYEAELLWSNDIFDMGIIVCDHFADLAAAVLKDRTVFCSDQDRINILEDVITVGTQSDLEYYATATTGEITSNLLRVAVSDSNLYEYLIQHDAAINHGNSGGALIDMEGNVIGLTL
jgi:S1-C subfamily serine protease